MGEEGHIQFDNPTVTSSDLNVFHRLLVSCLGMERLAALANCEQIEGLKIQRNLRIFGFMLNSTMLLR